LASNLASQPKITLDSSDEEKRFDFAKRHASWDIEMWKKGLLPDKSTVQHFSVRRYGVWRPVGTKVDKSHDFFF